MARYDQKRNDLIPYRKGRKKRNRIVPLCIGILSAVIILTIGMILVSFLEKNSLHSQGDRQNITGLKNESFGSEGNIEGADIKINLENLNSPNAILIDADSGEVLAEHNSKEQIYPASMTKIMTAIIAKQNAKDKAFVGGGGEGSTDGLYNSLSLLNIDNIGLSLVIC